MVTRAVKGGALLLAVASLAGCASTGASSPATTSSASTHPCGDTLRDIVAHAQDEGTVTLIGTPLDWANYGAVIDSFRDMYGLQVRVIDPDASSSQELDAVRATVGSPDRPDVIDIGSAFTLQAVDEGLVEPYRTTNWPQLSAAMKDPDGAWIGAYYGLMSIATNTTVQPVVPQTWADLLDPRYHGQVVLAGDPLKSGTGFGAVVAAALANGGSLDDLRPGIEYFARLMHSGNLRIMTDGTTAALAAGDAPIVIDWAYSIAQPGNDFGLPGSPIALTIPSDGVYGAMYTQSIVADPPHPCAARLWMEHITSDTGALGFANGLAIPARLPSLEAYGLITDELRQRLPRSSVLNALVLSDPSRLVAARKQVDALWGPMVMGRE